MINLLGLVIVLMFFVGLRREGYSFIPIENFFQRIGSLGRALIALTLAYGTASGEAGWGLQIFYYMASPPQWPALLVSLFYYALYFIHEAGHGFANLFVSEICVTNVLAGTAFQLIFPIGLSLYLLVYRSFVATGVLAIYAFGLSLLQTSPYIGDAKAQVLNIPQGYTHDWAYLLDRWQLLDSAAQFQRVFYVAGWVVVAAGLLAFVFFARTDYAQQE